MMRAFWTLRLLTTTIACLILVQGYLLVHAASNNLLIVELQTGGLSDASSEFVLIANVGGGVIDLSSWKVQYQSAAGSTWTTKATLQGTLETGRDLLISTLNFQTSEIHQSMTSGLAASGGHIRIVDPSGVVSDLVGWGTAIHPETTAATAPEPGQLLSRKADSNGFYIDSNNNQADFSLGLVASEPDPTTPPVPDVSTSHLTPPQITELLPNPASPATDASDEFVELFNPNSVEFPLKGYKLQTGTSFSYSLIFDSEVLPANGYAIFTSGQTSLTLSNSAGAARLLDEIGAVIDQTSPYDTASDGHAWALLGDSWQWTLAATPAAPNVLAAVQGAGTSTKTKAAAKSKTSTAKPKATKTSKSSATDEKSSEAEVPGTQNSRNLHPAILAGIGGLAVAYGVYEYRHDLANAFYKLRRYRANRRETG